MRQGIDRSINTITDTSDGWTMAMIDISGHSIDTKLSRLESDTFCLTVPKYLTRLISWVLYSKGIDNSIIDDSMGWIIIQNSTRYKINKVVIQLRSNQVNIDIGERAYKYLRELNLSHNQNYCS